MGQPNPAPPAPPTGDPSTQPVPPQPAPPQPAPATGQPATSQTGAPATGDGDQLGPGGVKALQAEREARKALEKQLAELAPLRQIAVALTGQGGEQAPGDPVQALTDRLAKHEEQLGEERAARWRAEVAHAQGLTPQQSEWLRGTTREELAASAEQLRAAWGAPAAGGQRPPGTPAPDPSQGARGAGPTIDARIADAQARAVKATGSDRQRIAVELVALQNEKLRTQQR